MTNYSDYSKEDLIAEITALKKRKKYGMVWDEEREPEQVVLQCKNELPVLKNVKSKAINNDLDKPTHILIEGDNYHVLSVLNYTHQNAIDVIYIDPPFNTGSRSWKYNNNYVDKEDSFKHSKFISFMAKRLRLSKSLLKDDGIIIVAIDDYEIHTIRFLLDEIFQEQNRLGTVTVVHNPRGRSDDKYFASSHEYMLIYGRDESKTITNKLFATEEQLEAFNKEDDISRYRELPFRRSGSNSRRQDRPNLFYPIYYNAETKEVSLEEKNNYTEIIPIDTTDNERVWRWGKETFLERYNTEIIIKERGQSFGIYTKDRIKEGRKPKTIWHDPKYDSSSHGTILLKKILNQRNVFEYPKSLYIILDILQIASSKQSTILDFFAGSGTTAHATMELNRSDGGNRRCIIVTNNENEICDNVCYPRVKNVINGYSESNGNEFLGYKDNLKYFRTTFVPARQTDKNKENLTQKSVDMLCLRENTFEPVLENDTIKIFKNNTKHTAILFDETKIDESKEIIKSLENKVFVYIFSLEDDDFSDEFDDMRGKVKVCSIPDAILNVYRRIFK